MTMRVALSIARRELRGGLRGFRVFLACLILGVAAIAAVGSVREAIRVGLDREGAVLLGGDAELELTYRFAEPRELQWMRTHSTAVSEIVDFRSMAVFEIDGSTERGLTQVKGVDAAYPLLGTVELEPALPLSEALDGVGGRPGAVMAPLLIQRLRMEVGDTFLLGDQEFILTAMLLSEPDNAGGGFSLGPRTIVRSASLEGSGLIQPGTLYETEYKLLLPEVADLDELQAESESTFTGVRWRDRRNGAPGVEQFVDRLGSFLVLVGLAGLAVGGVGISAAVTAFLEKKIRVIAILKTLGADSRTIFQIYFLQIGFLTLLGLVAGIVLGAIVPLILAQSLEARLPVPTVFAIHPRPLGEAALYGALTALIFTLWPLARVEQIRAAALFRGAIGPERGTPRWQWVLTISGLVAILVATAGCLSGLWALTLGATGGLIAAFAVLIFSATLMRRLARRAARWRLARGRPALRLALGSVGSSGGEATSVILSLGIGLTILAAVGQIDTNLRNAITRDLPEVAPSFFMVDIQPAQISGFLEELSRNSAVSRVDSAPMLRGIITAINGKPATEVAGDHWVLRGDRGVTYSESPPEGTLITHGEWWTADYNGLPQVSFATHEALELGLNLGDEITVNILGRDITANVSSFREVDFSTAGIGFVMSMNPAALRGAPHSFIATVYADKDTEAAIMRDVANAYPNITIISVRDAIDRVSVVLEGIAAAITYGALATLLTGGIVLIGAAAAGVHARTYEAAVLKTIGATRKTILTSFAMRSALFGAAAGVIAIIAGGVAGWAVMTFVMDVDYEFEPLSALLVVLGGISATLAAGVLFAWAPLGVRPARVLRDQV